MTIEERFQTPEQHMKILADEAMFSDHLSARCNAVDQLAEKYGIQAVGTINELIQMNNGSFDPFRAHCIRTIERLNKKIKRNPPT